MDVLFGFYKWGQGVMANSGRLQCGYKEIYLLNLILEADYAEADIIGEQLALSLRSIQTLVEEINDKLKRIGKGAVQIVMKRGKGYYLDYSFSELKWIENLKQQCHDYLNLSLNTKFAFCERAAHIIRSLLHARNGMRAEAIADKMNISLATFNKEIKAVKKILRYYGIEINSVPYYGMKLAGEPLAICSCIIDFCDIYTWNRNNIFSQHCLSEYKMDNRFARCRAQLAEVLTESGYPLTDQGFRRLVFCMMVYPTIKRAGKFVNNLEIAGELPEYVLAEKIFGEHFCKTELEYLAVFLLAHQDVYESENLDSYQKLVPEGAGISQAVLTQLKCKFSIDLSESPELVRCFQKFVYKWSLRNKYKIKEFGFTHSLQRTVNKMPSSMALAFYIYHELSSFGKIEYEDLLFFELTNMLYNCLHKLKNSYYKTNIILINEVGKMAGHTVCNNLQRSGLSSNNIHIYYYYLYELDQVNYYDYDCVFVSEAMSLELYSIPIPVYKYRFFELEFKDIWSKMIAQKRSIGSISECLEHPLVFEINADIKDGIAEMAGILKYGLGSAGDGYDLISYLQTAIYHTDYVTNYKGKYINLFVSTEVADKYFVFNFARIQSVNSKKIKSIHLILLETAKGMLEIKNGDSEIRHYIERI